MEDKLAFHIVLRPPKYQELAWVDAEFPPCEVFTSFQDIAFNLGASVIPWGVDLCS